MADYAEGAGLTEFGKAVLILRRLVDCDDAYNAHVTGCNEVPCDLCASWRDEEESAYADARAWLSPPLSGARGADS